MSNSPSGEPRGMLSMFHFVFLDFLFLFPVSISKENLELQNRMPLWAALNWQFLTLIQNLMLRFVYGRKIWLSVLGWCLVKEKIKQLSHFLVTHQLCYINVWFVNQWDTNRLDFLLSSRWQGQHWQKSLDLVLSKALEHRLLDLKMGHF